MRKTNVQKIANIMTTLAIAASVFGTAGGRVQAATAPPATPTPLTITETMYKPGVGELKPFMLLNGTVPPNFEGRDLAQMGPSMFANRATFGAPSQPDATQQCATTVLTGTASISGKVTVAGTGANYTGGGSANANLRVGSTFVPIKAAFISSQGAYTITDLPAGDYKIYLSPSTAPTAPPYTYQFYNNKPIITSADVVPVTDGHAVTGINFVLYEGGYLNGKVTAEDTGLPLASVLVLVYDASGAQVGFGFTDINGNYGFKAAPTSSYIMGFNPRFSSIPTTTLYSATFYSGTLDATQATSITITAPNTTTVNYALRRGSPLTGQVTMADTGLPVKVATVSLYEYNNGGVSLISANVDSNGFYTFALASGAYKLSVAALSSSGYLDQFYNNTTFYSATKLVVNAPTPLPPINFALQRGATITGRITDQASGDGLFATVAVGNASDNSLVGYGGTDTNGYYTATLPSGSYKVGFAKKGYLDSYYNGKGDIASAEVINATAPNAVANINGALRVCPVFNKKVFLPLVTK